MVAELETKDKKPSNSNLALFLNKDKITTPPHALCVHLGKAGDTGGVRYTPIVWQSARFKV